MHTEAGRLLSMLYLASPALPIGAFAYSQGLEKAIELEWVHDRSSLESWCRDALFLGLSKLDVPLILLLRKAISEGDERDLNALNDRVFACRESYELYEEEKHLGASLMRLFVTQDLASSLKVPISLPKLPSFLTAYAATSLALDMDEQQAQLSFLWSWLENQIAVSCKAIPLGQTDAQKILLALIDEIPKLLISANEVPEMEQLFGSLPGQVLCSALHEAQYSRLFRS